MVSVRTRASVHLTAELLYHPAVYDFWRARSVVHDIAMRIVEHEIAGGIALVGVDDRRAVTVLEEVAPIVQERDATGHDGLADHARGIVDHV